MEPMRRLELLLVLLWTSFMVAPGLGVGYLRDDWLLLWQALDPSGAPSGAAGVFPRPLAELQWWATAQLAGDAPWAMHAWSLAGWLLIAGLLWGWMRRRAGAPDGLDIDRLLVIAWAVSHAALVETRLWAAASNGVWAMALALTGAQLFGRHRRAALGLVLGAALLRADALVLLALPLARRHRRRVTADQAPSQADDPPAVPVSSALLILGAGLAGLAVMLYFGGDWSFAPADTGHALRRLVLPFGPPLPSAAATTLAGAGMLAAAALLLRHRRHPRVLLGLALAGTLAAFAMSSWSTAGRYLLAPVLLSALLLEPLARRKRVLRPVLVVLVVLQAGAAYFGHSARAITETAEHETSLYRTVRDRDGLPVGPLRIADPPAVGWRGSAADLENIVSAARRRPVEVEILLGEAAEAQLRFRQGRWEWIDRARASDEAADPLD